MFRSAPGPRSSSLDQWQLNDLVKNTGTLTKNFAQKTMQLKTDGQTTKDQNSFFSIKLFKEPLHQSLQVEKLNIRKKIINAHPCTL